MPIITMISDFGTRDSYVAEMKGVILQIAPSTTVIDVTHEVAPQDVLRAAFVLRRIWAWYPPGTVHLAVVDPTVGSKRRIMVGKYGGQFVVAPDNGLISLVHHELPIEAVHVVTNRDYMLAGISSTFQGRDVMAPVAAQLSMGISMNQFGPPTDHVEILQLAQPSRLNDQGMRGEVLCIDRFGNLITNIRGKDLAPILRCHSNAAVQLDGHRIGPVRNSYYEVSAGEPLALIGSSDYLEIAINCGHAANTLNAKRGTAVEIH